MAIGTLVDANALLDILTDDPRWYSWSSGAVATAIESGTVFINPIIYAEVSVNFAAIEVLDDALRHAEFQRLPLPWSASFLAGKAHAEYRRRGGSKAATLPDFFIGAHAAVSQLSLLTRDVSRYRTYFPTVNLISPIH